MLNMLNLAALLLNLQTLYIIPKSSFSPGSWGYKGVDKYHLHTVAPISESFLQKRDFCFIYRTYWPSDVTELAIVKSLSKQSSSQMSMADRDGGSLSFRLSFSRSQSSHYPLFFSWLTTTISHCHTLLATSDYFLEQIFKASCFAYSRIYKNTSTCYCDIFTFWLNTIWFLCHSTVSHRLQPITTVC